MNITGDSAKRNSRPTLEELDKLMTRFERTSRRDPSAIPMHKITLGALLLPYRLSELARIDVDDPTRAAHDAHATIVLRELKRPNGTAGNDVISLLGPEGPAVMAMMGKVAGRIFPYRPDAIGCRWTEACRPERAWRTSISTISATAASAASSRWASPSHRSQPSRATGAGTR